MLIPLLKEVGMEARSKDFTSAFLPTALDMPVLRENGIVIWRVSKSVRSIRFCLLEPARIGAFTLSYVWANAFRQSMQIATKARTDAESHVSVSGGALEGADV